MKAFSSIFGGGSSPAPVEPPKPPPPPPTASNAADNAAAQEANRIKRGAGYSGTILTSPTDTTPATVNKKTLLGS